MIQLVGWALLVCVSWVVHKTSVLENLLVLVLSRVVGLFFQHHLGETIFVWLLS